MLWKWESTFTFQKCMDNSLVTQSMALLSCKASRCPTNTEASSITQRMKIPFGYSNTLSQINCISGIQTPSAKSITSATLHLMWDDVNTCLNFPTNHFHSLVNNELCTFLSSILVLWPPKFLISERAFYISCPTLPSWFCARGKYQS